MKILALRRANVKSVIRSYFSYSGFNSRQLLRLFSRELKKDKDIFVFSIEPWMQNKLLINLDSKKANLIEWRSEKGLYYVQW
ncbi:hypothetical protein [uncultured Legionella sp.]|uniref:hypothetical protein n=1 Tax=uncultured Legionella sp. TaxID=210934 RepID=UPI0026183785|nr:hypothetical protein [uncultured Legionella sp.]